jgi:hypothetical protein
MDSVRKMDTQQNGLEWLRNSLIKLLLMVFVLQSTPTEFVGAMGF